MAWYYDINCLYQVRSFVPGIIRIKMNLSLNQQLKINGFTLIELILVLIILATLAVTITPKLINSSSFEDYTVREQLIARLRLVQLQSMNEQSLIDSFPTEMLKSCHWVVIKKTCFYHEQTDQVKGICGFPSNENVCADDGYHQYNKVTFNEGMLIPGYYRFNLDGRLSLDSHQTPIQLYGDNDLNIVIESEGYIHGSQQK